MRVILAELASGTRAAVAQAVRWAWRQRNVGLGVIAGALLVVMVVVAAVITDEADISNANDIQLVAKEWSTAMHRLGIEPVFPPTEDIHVGDLLGNIAGSDKPDQPVLSRNLRLVRL